MDAYLKRIVGFLFLYSIPHAVFPQSQQAVMLSQGASKPPIALVAHACAGSTDADIATTAAINTTGANFIVVTVSNSDPTPSDIFLTDSVSSTFTLLTNHGPDTGGGNTFIAYVANATTSASYTVQAALGTSFPSICVAAFSHVKTSSPFGTQNGAVLGSGSTFQPGSVTPALAGDLVIASLEPGTTPGTISINSGFTITDSVGFASSLHYPASLAYLISPAGSAVNPTWTSTVATSASTAIATFSAQ